MLKWNGMAWHGSRTVHLRPLQRLNLIVLLGIPAFKGCTNSRPKYAKRMQMKYKKKASTATTTSINAIMLWNTNDAHINTQEHFRITSFFAVVVVVRLLSWIHFKTFVCFLMYAITLKSFVVLNGDSHGDSQNCDYRVCGCAGHGTERFVSSWIFHDQHFECLSNPKWKWNSTHTILSDVPSQHRHSKLEVVVRLGVFSFSTLFFFFPSAIQQQIKE